MKHRLLSLSSWTLGLFLLSVTCGVTYGEEVETKNPGSESCDAGNKNHPRSLSSEATVTTTATPETDPWFLTNESRSESGDYDNFWNDLDCETLMEEGGPRPIPPIATWGLLRGVYYGIVGPQQSTIDYLNLPIDGNGFLVPVTVGYVPEKGRGIFAAEDIPKGTVVWDEIFTARFPSPIYFRRFLSTIPREMACDVLIWAYSEDYAWDGDDDDDDPSNKRPTLSVDLDIGSLMNTENKETDEWKNVDNENCEATRLIRKGEEILVDYKEFERKDSWRSAGFGSAHEDDEVLWG